MNPIHAMARVVHVDGRIYAATAYYACKAVVGSVVDPKEGFHVAARQWGQRLLSYGGVTFTTRDADRVDWSKPTVLMANHVSLYDIPVLFVAVPTNLHFLSKQELRAVPLMGWSMERGGGFVFIDRRDPVRSKKSIDLAVQQVLSGRTVAIFPEGTRSKNGVLRSFKKGGFVLATKAKAQVVPVYLDGTHSIIRPDTWLVHSGHVEVRVGHPIQAAEYSFDHKEALMERVHAELTELSQVPALQPTGARTR